MLSHPMPPPRVRRLAPLTHLSLVQHNSLGSWDVFLSLFHSLTDGPPVDFVLLQDPPVSKGFLPSFPGFKSFAPPVSRPRVAIYASLGLLSFLTVSPVFSPDAEDFLALDIYTPNGCFGTKAPRFRLASVYSRVLGSPSHSVPPHTAFQPVDFPYLVAGDFNIHNPAADALRISSPPEDLVSAPYYNRAAELGFHLLNTPGVYTRFPSTARHRPSVIDLAFANPHMLPFFRSWDASSLPSTGSDHVPIRLTLQPPSDVPPPRPRWDDTDWAALQTPLADFRLPPTPDRPSPRQLDTWFTSSLNTLVALLKGSTPLSRPSPRSKPWWTQLLTDLRKEFTKADRAAKKHRTDEKYAIAKLSRRGYFKAIKRAKALYWADFLAKTTPHNIWTAKQLVAPRKNPEFPTIPEADSSGGVNKALLGHLCPPRPPLPPRGRLFRHAGAGPLSAEEIARARAKSSPSSAPGPDEIPYSVWKKVNSTNPDILLGLLSPLVAFGYHPPSLKVAHGVVLDKPGKASYDSPSSFRIIVLLRTISKILERVMTVRLSALARSAGLLHLNQCGSLPGLSTADACATLMHEVRTLQRPRLKVSTLFLDIKAGFDNVNVSTLRNLLLQKKIPSYMVDWVSSFLSERRCTLVFQGSPNISSPVSVGTPQGSPISPLLFLIYVALLHVTVPRGIMVSYVDDFSLTVASPSHRTNVGRLQRLFETISGRAKDAGVSFSVPKTELIHWRTPSQRT